MPRWVGDFTDAMLRRKAKTAWLCSEIGLELARSFQAMLDAALERLTAGTRRS